MKDALVDCVLALIKQVLLAKGQQIRLHYEPVEEPPVEPPEND